MTETEWQTPFEDDPPDWKDSGRCVQFQQDDGRTVDATLTIADCVGDDGEVPVWHFASADGRSVFLYDVQRWRFADGAGAEPNPPT